MTDSDVLTLAQHALDLVGTDPRAALREADDVLTVARPRVSPEAVSTAQRAAALALKEMGDLPSAERRLRAGLRSTAGHAARAEAEARMSLAFILLERGQPNAALAQADRAATSLTGVEGARLLGQRALVLQRCGREPEALAAYGQALPVLRRAGDAVWEARLLNNRGLLHAYRGSIAQARSDLLRARELMAAGDQRLDVADVDWNLGFVASVDGDIPEALDRYDRAEAFYTSEGLPLGRLLVDRGLVLLRAGLLDEARLTLIRASDDLSASGAEADQAEALVALAQVDLARGARVEAVEAAGEAMALLRRQHRPGWSLLAKWTQYVGSDLERDDRWAPRGRLLARQLRAAGWHDEEREVLLLLTREYVARSELKRARQLLKEAHAVRTRRASSTQPSMWHTRALLSEAEGNRPSALRAARAGLSQLDRQRALLGATELRVGVAARGSDLASLALRVAVDGGTAASVFEFAERSRAGALRVAPVLPPRGGDLARALTDVRRASALVQSARLSGEPGAAEAAELAHAEERVLRLSRVLPGSTSGLDVSVSRVGEVADELGTGALAEFVSSGGRFYVVTIVEGWARLHDLGPERPIALEADTLRFTLQRLATRPSERLLANHHDAAERLAALLLGPAPELTGRPLVVTPVGVLQSLPWHVLPGIQEQPLTVAPSATLWRRALAVDTSDQAKVSLAAGPDLPAASDEIAGVHASWPAATVLTGSDATVERTLDLLDGAAVAHVAAHGRLRSDNPLFSSLQLFDGPLTVYDIEGLSRVPTVVVLPACRSAVSSVRSGEELLGLSAAFLSMGSRSVISSVVPVADTQTATFMPLLHRHLSRGLSPSDALAAARRDLNSPEERLVGGSFVCLGAG